MKNIKITNRDKKILFILAGVLLIVLSYLLVFRPQMDKANERKIENEALQVRLDELLEMKTKQDFYESETARMKKEVAEYCRMFPADIKPEDGIMLARNMEGTLGIAVPSVGLGEKELIASMDGTNGEEETADDETLKEKGNENTQKAIDEIEGNTEEETSAAGMIVSYSPTLYRTQNSMTIQLGYHSMKEMVRYLNNLTGIVTIESINAGFDATTGRLNGTLNVNMFSMTGTDAIYTEPTTGSEAHGTPNLFGTID